jgi:hypothetical protein
MTHDIDLQFHVNVSVERDIASEAACTMHARGFTAMTGADYGGPGAKDRQPNCLRDFASASRGA